MEATTNQPVILTENAIKEVKRIMETNNMSSGGLRVGVTGGGCAGFTYTLNFDNEIAADDQVYEVEGVKVIIDMKSSLYLAGTTIDYTSGLGLTGGGFKFVNPQAKGSCGCGTSFSA